MSKAISTAKAAVPTKKEARKLISEKIEQALPELKTALGDKKFHNRLKKAVKILSEDFTALSAPAPKANETPSSAEPAKQNVPVKKAANAKPVPKAKAKSVKPKVAKTSK